MSKSLGNGIDPMQIGKEYGTDTLRYFISTNGAPGQDLRYEEEKILSSWNYINKIWNISRYILMNIDENTSYSDYVSLLDGELTDSSKWILNRLNKTITEADDAYEKYDFGIAAKTIYNFVWDDFASWYIELSKVDLALPEYKKSTEATLLYTLTAVLKLLHPIMPFVTEEIYQHLPHDEEALIIASWPKVLDIPSSETTDLTIEIISSVRNLRHNANKGMSIKLDIDILGPNSLADSERYFRRFINPDRLSIVSEAPKYEASTAILANATVYIPMEQLIDIQDEIIKLEAKLAKLKNELDRSEKMLSNPNFTTKAPKEKIEAEQLKQNEYRIQYQNVIQELNKLR